MDKPDNPYREGSILWRLFEGQWAENTLEEIADELDTGKNSVYCYIGKIKRDTGYKIEYTKSYGDCPKKKKVWPKMPPSYRPVKPGVRQNCETCGNVDCGLYVRRRAVTFCHCSGWIPEEVAAE